MTAPQLPLECKRRTQIVCKEINYAIKAKEHSLSDGGPPFMFPDVKLNFFHDPPLDNEIEQAIHHSENNRMKSLLNEADHSIGGSTRWTYKNIEQICYAIIERGITELSDGKTKPNMQIQFLSPLATREVQML